MEAFLNLSTLTTWNQYILCKNYCIMSLIFRIVSVPSSILWCLISCLYGFYVSFDTHDLFSIDTSVFCIIYFDSHDMYV